MDRSAETASLLAGLHDIRLPSEAPGGLPSEIAAALALGLMLALALAPLLRLATRRRAVPRHPSLRDRVAGLRDLAPQERVVALLHLLREVRPEALSPLRPALYAPGPGPAPEVLEALILGEGSVAEPDTEAA